MDLVAGVDDFEFAISGKEGDAAGDGVVGQPEAADLGAVLDDVWGILPDGRNLNQELVSAGLAWWYMQYAKRDAVLPVLEREARAARRGLWIDASAAAPWVWRKVGAAR
ncbi:MAG: thermonuclease family protein [Candidatus Solibacter sp.]